MTGIAQIIRANARHLPLADDSVDLVVTSPPYFALRSYQDGGEHYSGQIGDEATPAEFVDALLEVTRECVRVLKPSGSLWVNLGDKYAQSEERSRNGNGNRAAIDNFPAGSVLREPTVTLGRKDNGVPRKSLIGIPWRYAIRCIDELGLILRAEVIWSKPNGLPESVTDRVRRSHETWFHFVLRPRYFSAVDEIREATDPDVDRHVARYSGREYGKTNAARGDMGASNFIGNPLGKLPGSVWTIPTEPLIVPPELGVDHFAAFPTEWPRRIIQGWSPAGVCVECGEGRRPVSRSEITGDRGGRQFNPSSGNVGVLGKERVYEITGYVCACSPRAHEDAHGPDVAAGPPTCKCGREFETWRAQGIHETAERRKPPTPLPPTTSGVVLDPFGGTGTTALVAKALGRTGISVDMSADYCRLAQWRTNDPKQLAKAARREFKASEAPIEGQMDMLAMLDGEAS